MKLKSDIPTISIVTPIYKDGYLAKDFCAAVLSVFGQYKKVELAEIIFIIDGGIEKDFVDLQKIAADDKRFKVLRLSRNFGQHIALSAGYEKAIGDIVCMINVDQQDPVESIPELVEHLINNEAYDVVYGLRETRTDSFITRVLSKSFNFILFKLTSDDTPLNVATIRVMSSRFIKAYNTLNEKSRYIPGLENWLGFKRDYIPIKQNQRIKGKSSYTFKKKLVMALDSIVSFSDLPLRWITFIGGLIALIGFLCFMVLVFAKFFFIDFKPGFTTTIALMLFLGGVQIVMIGLASIYIGRILSEVQNRPLYIIKDRLNI